MRSNLIKFENLKIGRNYPKNKLQIEIFKLYDNLSNFSKIRVFRKIVELNQLNNNILFEIVC